MKISNCKLKKTSQKKLLEYFVLSATARSTVDMLGIQANKAMLDNTQIRTPITGGVASMY